MGAIRVRGVGTVEATPDEAVVTFEVAAVADRAAEAFAAATEQARELDAVLDDAGVEPERRSTVGIAVHEHHEVDAAGQPRRAHRASTTVDVRLAGSEAIAALLAAAVERADAHVRGPLWRLGDTGDATAEAGRRAVADATRRAETYAGALGRKVGPVEAVEEVAAAGPIHPVVARTVLAADAVPVHPGELTVSVAVDVVFALEP